VSAGSAQSARQHLKVAVAPFAAVMDLSELDAPSAAERNSAGTPQGYSITGLLMTAAGGAPCTSDSLLSASLLSAFAAAPSATVVHQQKFQGQIKDPVLFGKIKHCFVVLIIYLFLVSEPIYTGSIFL